MRERKFDAARLEDLINHRSGLLGISGISSDMRRRHEVASFEADARLAIRMFSSSVAKQVAAMITVLEGVDMVVFTGGIGENNGEVRAAICGRLAWMGIKLDDARNRSAGDPISDSLVALPGSRPPTTGRRADCTSCLGIAVQRVFPRSKVACCHLRDAADCSTATSRSYTVLALRQSG